MLRRGVPRDEIGGIALDVSARESLKCVALKNMLVTDM
jgi:hypothetical protein